MFDTTTLDSYIEDLYNGKLIPEEAVTELSTHLREILLAESTVVSISAPVTIVGDIHGQYYDLLEMFNIAGKAPDTNFLFMGDYVDRGYHSIECATLLFLLKVRYPNRVTLLRGNHESRQTSQVYGFYDECIRKYGSANVWRLFTDLFDFLPLACLVGGSILAVHGGISKDIPSIDSIRAIDRFREIPQRGPMSDLLWSDPHDDENEEYGLSQRGAGATFGVRVSRQFNRANGLTLVARAHQVCMEGYSWAHDRNVVTIFSAPCYCNKVGNRAAVMQLEDDCRNFRFQQYEQSGTVVLPKVVRRAPAFWI